MNTGAECGENQFEKTMIIRPPAKDIPEAKEADKEFDKSIHKIAVDLASADNTASGSGPAKLQLISGTNAGKELQLSKILTTLGRPGVQTAAITRRPTGYFLIVVDADKDKNTPLFNDTEIHKEKSLADGDVIEVAGVQMSFNLA